MTRTRIKICGLTRVSDVQMCVEAGVDFVGIVLVPGSKRCVSLDQAQQLMSAARPFTQCVLLFMDHPSRDVAQAVERLRPDLLQFHGNESAEYCDQFAIPYLKAIAFQDPRAAAQAALMFPAAAALLADGHGSGAMGGSGQRVDDAVQLASGTRWFLAGGLNPQNVAHAIRTHRPFSVDVSSGVESAPGIKDPNKIRAFVNEVMKQNAS